MTQAQKLEALLSKVQANRTRPRSEVAPASAPVRRSKSPTRSQSPLEIAVEHQLDVSPGAAPSPVGAQSAAPVAGTEPSPPPAVEPSLPPMAPAAAVPTVVNAPDVAVEPVRASTAVEPSTIDVAPAVQPAAPVVNLRGTAPEVATLSFGQLLSRSLALRP